MSAGSSTSLVALDAVVIDSETTGLEPAKARLVEVAAVRLAAGQIDTGAPFRRLVRPGMPIPASATEFHGISDATVADAPAFGAIWPDLSAYLDQKVVIGHSLGFDLAVLKHECERAGFDWVTPNALDTRLLAEVTQPNLSGYSLDALAAWLGVDVAGRHSALGDAMTTARIFCALVPRLREVGIRTLGEASQACRALTHVLDEQHRAGWVPPAAATSRDESAGGLFRLDAYPYRHRAKDVMSTPKFITADTPISTAISRMARERVSSLFVLPRGAAAAAAPRPEDTGIITERDVLRALAERGADALAMPAEAATTWRLAAVSAEAFVYRAIGRMSRLKVRHLGVTDTFGRLCGALSARDLLRQRAEEAVWLGDEIDQSEDVAGLANAWSKLPLLAACLVPEGVSGRDVAAVISAEIGALTRRAAVLAERRMQADGHGGPPCAYAVGVLGSAGRGESLLAMDQDNALMFAEGAPDGPEDRWFATFASHANDILHQVGVPYCKGGVMARNPAWRGSMLTWRDRIADWIKRSNPNDLLSVDIFFDLRGVHGDLRLASALRQDAYDVAAGEVGFAKLLAEAAGTVEPGLTFFGGFRTDDGRIDLKKTGLFGIVTGVRVLAIRHHIAEQTTLARIEGLKALGIGGQSDLDALAEAQGVFLDLVLRQQIDDIDTGRPASNAVRVKRLSKRDRDRLYAAFQAVKHLDDLVRDLLFKG
jgi:DNA polymerase-3 subunit epsilon/CBS domain-containing protein